MERKSRSLRKKKEAWAKVTKNFIWETIVGQDFGSCYDDQPSFNQRYFDKHLKDLKEEPEYQYYAAILKEEAVLAQKARDAYELFYKKIVESINNADVALNNSPAFKKYTQLCECNEQKYNAWNALETMPDNESWLGGYSQPNWSSILNTAEHMKKIMPQLDSEMAIQALNISAQEAEQMNSLRRQAWNEVMASPEFQKQKAMKKLRDDVEKYSYERNYDVYECEMQRDLKLAEFRVIAMLCSKKWKQYQELKEKVDNYLVK